MILLPIRLTLPAGKEAIDFETLSLDTNFQSIDAVPKITITCMSFKCACMSTTLQKGNIELTS
jgi:hypothetical protein